MKVIVDLPERLVTEIRQKVSEGKYSNIASFVLASVENQLVLESEDSEMFEIPTETKTNQVVRIQPKSTENLELVNNSFPLLEPQNTQIDQNPGKQWIWGQINKILPIKFVVRHLANEQAKIKDCVVLSEFQERVCSSARSFGLSLKKMDDRSKRRRDERLSTAFPIGGKEEKAMSRFSSQFVGNIRTDGKFVGALADFKFASVNLSNERPQVGLTRFGFEFAKLQNPVIDMQETTRSLSTEEIEFYLHHIKQNVRAEYTSFLSILQLIRDGVTAREDINHALRNTMPKEWSDEVVNTARAGAMSRMYELGLISKSRQGTSVTYHLTELGLSLLK